MKKIKYWMSAVVVAVVALVIPMGCDDGGSGDNGELDAYFASHPYVSAPRDGSSAIVTMTPASATLSTVGEKAAFKINGGSSPYSWDVSDPSKGSISGSGGQRVYTVTVVGKNDIIAYDRNGNAAIAKISGSGSSTTNATLSASPSSAKLSPDGAKAVLTATGGVPPYTWDVQDKTIGSLPWGMIGSQVTYMRTGSGDNTIKVTDDLGASKIVWIEQP